MTSQFCYPQHQRGFVPAVKIQIRHRKKNSVSNSFDCFYLRNHEFSLGGVNKEKSSLYTLTMTRPAHNTYEFWDQSNSSNMGHKANQAPPGPHCCLDCDFLGMTKQPKQHHFDQLSKKEVLHDKPRVGIRFHPPKPPWHRERLKLNSNTLCDALYIVLRVKPPSH